MTDFRNLLRTAMGLGVLTERTQAELTLQNLCMTDPGQFFTNLVNELILEANPVEYRQFAGTLIKNSIRLQINNDFMWNMLDHNLRESIKQTLLSTMICKISLIKKSCANAISTIFTVEVLNNRWNNLIEDLTASSQPNIGPDIRKAAILTLGQICDKLKEFKLGQLLPEKSKENVLMAILVGLTQDEQDLEIRENSIIALGDCVEFMTDILDREQVRDFATGLLIDALQHQNEDIRTTALQRTTDFVKAIYVHFAKYAPAMLNATRPSIQSNETEISLPAIEIWTTIANEFQERKTSNAQQNRVNNEQLVNPNHIMIVQEDLVQLLLQNLLKNDGDTDEAESSIQDSSQKALCAIVECAGDVVVNIFTIFIQNTISNQAWQYRQAAILAFSSLIEGISEQTIIQLINSVLPNFVNTLKDSNPKVKESGAKLLQTIAEFYPQTFLLRQNIGNEIAILLQSLKDQPKISRWICWCFCFMAQKFENYPQNQLSGSLDVLISALIENATRADYQSGDSSVISVSFMSALNFINYSHDINLASKYLNLFLSSFDNTYQLPNDRRGAIQSGILSVMHTCLLTILNKLDLQLGQKVYELVIKYFTSIKDVDDDGIYVISALATCIEGNFSNYLDQSWQYIEHVLQNKQEDFQLFKTCLGTIADIARACELKIVSKLDVLHKFFTALQAPHINRDIKLNIFQCIGDIFLSGKQHTIPYLPKLISIYDQSFTAVVELSRVDSTDQQEYADQLKEKIIESYTCVLHGINEQQIQREFLAHCPKLVEFIMFTCDKNLHPTVEYVRMCLNLLTDIGNFYKSEAAPQIRTHFTKDLIDTLQKFDRTNEGAEAIQYANSILQQI